MVEEEWLELPLDGRYLISTQGRLYSTVRCRMLQPQWTVRGKEPALYWRLGRARVMVRAAHWVLTVFGPPRPSPFFVATHVDGDRANLHIDNLEWRHRLTNQQLTDISRSRPDVSPQGWRR